MFKHSMLAVTAVGLLAAATIVLTGCGGSDPESGAAGEAGGVVAVTMGSPDEFALTPSPAEIGAGSVTFNVANDGAIEHEMVIVRTDEGAANLGTDSGEADETGAVDEIVLEAGKSGDLTVDLQPGAYVLLCNLPEHYVNGMYADFTVR